MTSVEILRHLPQLFRYADVEKYTRNANVFLTRALAKGFVERLARGVYLNAMRDGRPAIEEVACFLRTPSYISCEWALNQHGVILQAPFVCTVLTMDTAVGRSRNVDFSGVTIEFSRIASRLFTGYEMRNGFNLALPEKALLDTIYLRKHIPFPDELNLQYIKKDTLVKMAMPFPAVVKKRLEEILPKE